MSVVHTFRISVKTNNALREEAKRAGLTLNAFVNRLLDRYADTYRFFQRRKTVTLSDRTLSIFLDELSEDHVTAIGKKLGVENPLELTRIFGREPDEETFRFFLVELLPAAGWCECEEGSSPAGKSYFLHHSHGPRWTLFLLGFLEGMSAIFYIKVKFEPSKEGLYCELAAKPAVAPKTTKDD